MQVCILFLLTVMSLWDLRFSQRWLWRL